MIIIPLVICSLLLNAILSDGANVYSSTFTVKHLALLRAKSKEMFNHAWDSYLNHGFPADEVRPLSCTPHTRDRKDPFNLVSNDVMGNFSVTVFDNLDSFLLLGEPDVFKNLIYWIRDAYPSFDIDSDVQVFETNIRVLGGLLSAHLYASDERKGYAIDGYDGFLLRLAHDLGERLILAFDTRSSIPFPRTNLAKGPLATPKKLQAETCTAGAGSPILEFTLLSRLTGDGKFERKSRRLFMTLWNSRTELDLLPMTIDPHGGKWLDSVTGIGASVDSFYEYALKSAILFDDDELFQVWKAGYQALNTHLQSEWVYENVDTRSGQVFVNWIDSLSAFWPGLQVLAGDVSNAVKLHSVFLKIWETFDAIPERWNTNTFEEELPKILDQLPEPKKNEVLVAREISLEWYPLRPEFIESTYHLYRATKDPVYLQIGQDFLHKLETKYKAPCGFSGMLDIRTNTHQDRMESFVLSETLKYLYLLFDEDNPVHKNNNGNLIFSTEAHPLWFDKQLRPEITGFDWFMDGEFQEEEEKIHHEEYIDEISIFDKLPNFIQDWWSKEDSTQVLVKQFDEHAKFVQQSLDTLNENDPVPMEFKTELTKIISSFHNLDAQQKLAITGSEIESLSAGLEDEVYSELFVSSIKVLKKYLSVLSHATKENTSTLVQKSQTGMLNVGSYNLSQVLFFESDRCVLPQVYQLKDKDRFLTSPFLSFVNIYHMDHRYEQNLVKPLYLSDKSYDRGSNTVELSYDFYHLYTSHLAVGPTSLRYPTTDIFEGLFDPRDQIRENRVYHLLPIPGKVVDNGIVQPHDMYIEQLTGSRLRFEKLQIGDIDYNNDYITEEFIHQFNNNDDDYAFKILKINGYKVPADAMIWLSMNDTRINSSDILSNNGGHLTIDNTTVVNFMLWLG